MQTVFLVIEQNVHCGQGVCLIQAEGKEHRETELTRSEEELSLSSPRINGQECIRD